MVASTWFQTSAWPPGNHGIMPVGSCHSAMDSAVSATSAAVRIPGTSGSRGAQATRAWPSSVADLGRDSTATAVAGLRA